MDFGFATPGITQPNFSADPLGTEGEMTPGPDKQNPFEEAQERAERQLIRERKERAEKEQKRRECMNPLCERGGTGGELELRLGGDGLPDLDVGFSNDPSPEPEWWP